MYSNYYPSFYQYQFPNNFFQYRTLSNYANPYLMSYSSQMPYFKYPTSVGLTENLQTQLFAPYRCCDYYNSEVDQVITFCEDINEEPDACPDTYVLNGYTYNLIVQRNYDTCQECTNPSNLKQRLNNFQNFSGIDWRPVKRMTIFQPYSTE